MNLGNYCQASHFQLEGQFVGFIGKSGGKLKYLRVVVEECELEIKLAKYLRVNLGLILVPGDRIQVWGQTHFKGHPDEIKLKAFEVKKLASSSEQIIPNTKVLASTKKAKILICQKSGCLKRGGKKQRKALEAALATLNLQNQVTIETTGCQKRCSHAPNMVLMPGKTRCSKIQPEAIATLLKKHYLVEEGG